MKTLILILSLIFCAGLNSFSQKKSCLEIGTALSGHLVYPEVNFEYSWNFIGISGLYKYIKDAGSGAGIRGNVYLNNVSDDLRIFLGAEAIWNTEFEKYRESETGTITYSFSNGYGLFAGAKCAIRESRFSLIFKAGEIYCPEIEDKFLFNTSLGISYRIIK